MKSFMFFLLLLISVSLGAQESIPGSIVTKDLKIKMDQNSDSEMIRINIRMINQYDLNNLNEALANFDPETKRAMVINELKTFRDKTQKDILNYLAARSAEQKTELIFSLWITNVITCWASEDVINELALRSDIDRIDWDETRKMIIDNEYNLEVIPGSTNGGKEITWNVTKVNAPAVWSLGYTGAGVLVGVLDTGVNYNHVDLADHLWTDPSYPYHGYDFVNNDNNPMDDHGHGTHCAGTVAGDGTAGSQTGMAPDATIMCVKVLDAGGSGTESGVWAAIEFAVNHGVDIISMSLGWQHSWGVDRASWRNTYNNALAAGVIAAVAAGNEGDQQGSYPIPDNVRTPGDCPPPWLHPDQTLTGGLSAVVCVGATNSSDAIASFSSRGPCKWSTISPFNDYAYNPGMGLIRPDISAPGVNIKSLNYSSNTGYADGWNGTSMATPCVAGVMALMKQKDPGVTPAYMDMIIETTAVELGSAGKDNTFGSGRINALTAINALGLVANFSANITEVCTGGSVTFTDLSGGSPTSWNWSFPGGNPSSWNGENPPPVSYISPGSYDVSLTVSDGSDTDTETKTGYINVNNVIANFTGTPTTVVVGNSVTFTDNSSCNPTSWSWTFTGGTPSSYSGQTPPAITYNSVGTYTVSLTVAKPGGTDTETKTNYITVVPPEFNMANGTVTTCTGNFYDSGGPSGSYQDNENFTMTFFPSTPGAMVRMTFGSFSTEAGYDYLRIYNGTNTSAPLIGTYHGTTGPGTVTASNASGALTFNFTSDVYITSTGWVAAISCYSNTQPPIADFTASTTTPTLGQTVTFTDISNNAPTAWAWSFTPNTITYVGGTNSGSQNPQVQFNAIGTYTVSLTATNAYGSDTETKTNYINVMNCSYCASSGANASEEWISNVTFNTINNNSGGVGYQDFTSLSTNITKGSSYNLSVTISFNGGPWTEHVWAFIDWNQDCDFTDSGESFDLGQVSAAGTLTLSIPVPASASNGATRMRVSQKYNGDPTSCEAFSYGEVEDYSVNVQSAMPPPLANFTASTTTPNVGQTVNFTDLSTNTPSSWSWSFSPNTVTFVGGTSSTSQNPQVQFNNPGYYSVTLTATNAGGSDSETKSNYIFALLLPVANFVADNTTPIIGATVSFSDLSSNTPTSWSWSFTPNTVTFVGGTSAASQNPQVQFNAGGYYTVSLTAVNAYGSDNETKTNYINVIAPPVADFSASTTTPLIGQTVTFTDLSTNAPTSWQWFFSPGSVTFVGGTSPTSQNPQVQFTSGGYYTVSLVATNAAGSDNETKTNYIAVYGVPVANFTASNTNPLLNQTVSFTDLSTNLPTSWSWSFSPNTVTYVGGTGSSSQNPQVQFNAGGYYTVSLTVSNSQGTDNETKTNYIFVLAPPLADFTAGTTTPVLNQTVTFTDLSTNSPTTWFWSVTPNTVNYMNGTIPTSQNPQIRFNAGGYYTVSLTASNAAGSDNETKVNYIFVSVTPVADFMADITNPVANQTVSFTDLSNNTPVSWNWVFSPNTVSYVGGSNSASQNPQVQFNATGNYTVTLTATNLAGSDSETKINYIYSVVAPVANFAASNTTPSVGQTVVFTDQSTNVPNSWNWSFSPNTVTYVGGTGSSYQNPQIHFMAAGYYTVTLTASNVAGTDTETKVDYIYVSGPPVADFTASTTTPVLNETVVFTDLSTNIPSSWNWSFSPNSVTYTNGTTSASQNPQVQFNAGGYYTVTLVASNASGSDSEVKTDYIIVTAPPETDFIADDLTPVTGQGVAFTDLTLNIPISWSWTITPNTVTFTGGTSAFSQNPQVEFNEGGFYTVSLTATNAAGTDTETKTDYIFVTAPPVADFIAGNTTPLTGETVTFTDLSSNNPTTWLWSFVPGSVTYVGGTSALSQNPQVTFDAAGFYTVSLTVTNEAGSDTETKNLYIYVTSPIITVSLNALLEGPFNGAVMNTYINTILPLNQPYSGSPWNYSGTETVSSVPNADVVDWVLVELRETSGDASTATGSTMIAQQAGFILSDGSITAIDGTSDMQFNVMVTTNLYVVIWHRNHLGIMSSSALSISGGLYSYDFTTGSDKTFGDVVGCSQLSPTQWGMISADGNSDGNVNVSDRNNVWAPESGTSGYKQGDFNLNGNVNNIDKLYYWRPNSGKSTQVPN